MDCAYWFLQNVVNIRKKIAEGKNRGDIPDYEEPEPQSPTEYLPIELVTLTPVPQEEKPEPQTENVPIEVVTPSPISEEAEPEPQTENVPIEVVTPTPTPQSPTKNVPIEVVTPTPVQDEKELEPQTENVPIEVVSPTPTLEEEEPEPQTENVPIEVVSPTPEPQTENVPIEVVTSTPTPEEEEPEPQTENVPIEVVSPTPALEEEETEPQTENVPIEVVTPTPTPEEEEPEPQTENIPIEVVSPTSEPPTEKVPIEVVSPTPALEEEETEPQTENVPIEVVTPTPTPEEEEPEPQTENIPIEVVSPTPLPEKEEPEPQTDNVPIEVVTPTPEPFTENVPIQVVTTTPVPNKKTTRSPSSDRQPGSRTSTTSSPARNTLIQISTIQDIGNCVGSCPKFNGCNSVYLAHRNCEKFCQCSNGRPIVMDCPAKLHFNIRLNVCDYPRRAGCPEIKTIPPTNNCRLSPKVTPRTPKYQGVSIIRQSERLETPHNYNFKVSTEQDSDYCKGYCPRVDGYNSVYLPHVNCRKFCQCFIGHAVVFDCPGNLHFNTKLNVCDWPQNAGCTGVQNPNNRFSEESNISLKPLVVVKDSNSPKYCQGTCSQFVIYSSTYMPNAFCNRFCQCANGRPYVFECPQHLHFNPKLNVCDWPHNAQCTGIGGLGKKWYL
uniref:Chitin-binding type-2 domain-containing protein n=1 Tax=Trichogramma kaykai TaxID=54128 RepID=A0ABD2WT99_9HYME